MIASFVENIKGQAKRQKSAQEQYIKCSSALFLYFKDDFLHLLLTIDIFVQCAIW